MGSGAFIFLTLRLRVRLQGLGNELDGSSEDVKELTEKLGIEPPAESGDAHSAEQRRSANEAAELGRKISAVRKRLRAYIDNAH